MKFIKSKETINLKAYVKNYKPHSKIMLFNKKDNSISEYYLTIKTEGDAQIIISNDRNHYLALLNEDKLKDCFGSPEIKGTFDPKLNTLTFDSNEIYDVYLNRDAGDCSASV